MSPELLAKLKEAFKGEIEHDAETLSRYSHDASLIEVRPQVVVFPRNAEDVKDLVRFVSEHKKDNAGLALAPRAAGTCMSGGSLTESIVVDMNRHMKGVLEVKEGEARVLSGTFYRDLEAETLKTGQILPCYTASKNICAVGGMIANNAGGEKTLRYGKMEDYILELKVVLSDGNEYAVKPLTKAELDLKMAEETFEGKLYKEIFEVVSHNVLLLKSAKPKVSKNSAGYYLWNVWNGKTFDLTKLIVGSQGTLGIVTEARLKLVPVKKHSKLYVMFLKDLAPVSEIVNEILPFEPESLESYDDHTLGLAVKFLPSMIKSMKGNFIKFAWSFIPEVKMALTGGIPKLVLLVEFADDSLDAIDAKMEALDRKLSHFGLKTRITESEAEAEKYWTIRRESFNLLRKHVKGRRTAPFIDDVIVRPEHLPEFIPKLTKILREYELTYTVAGHAGDGNFHVIPLMDMHDPRNAKIIGEVSDKVYDLVLSLEGSITAEHNDGIVRTPYLPKMFGPAVMELFKKTKNAFDPKAILNPGKKVDGSMNYFKSHIVRE